MSASSGEGWPKIGIQSQIYLISLSQQLGCWWPVVVLCVLKVENIVVGYFSSPGFYTNTDSTDSTTAIPIVLWQYREVNIGIKRSGVSTATPASNP